MKVLKRLLEANSPKISDRNKFADYIELLCIVSENKSISADDIFDRINDEALGELVEEIDEGGYFETGKAAIEDKRKGLIREVFVSVISTRFAQLKQYYPFKYNNKHHSIEVKNQLFDENYFYLALLLSSNLRFIGNPYSSQLPKIFEEISLEFFKKFLPKHSESYIFGTGSSKNKLSKGNFYERLNSLSKELNLIISSKVNPNIEIKNKSGERGLDLVGWVKLNDKAPGTLMLFAQCACGEQWEDKQLESHAISWTNYIDFFNKPSNILFFPHNFRNPEGLWENNAVIRDTILIDRKRFLELHSSKMNKSIIEKYKSIVDDVLSEKVSNFD